MNKYDYIIFDIDEILQAMNLPNDEIQRIQTAHRLKLIEFWDIVKGTRILEIGCGQGDTLSALAVWVGPDGFVNGVDVAEEDYGAPETLGQAKERLTSGVLKNNIRIDLHTDILMDDIVFSNKFDYVVLSHCLWYFLSYEQLVKILIKAKELGNCLCIAEWNPCITMPEQVPRINAVTVQAICGSFHPSEHFNIRTLFYPADIERAVTETGWTIERRGEVYSPDMQDAKWEIETAISLESEICKIENMPLKLQQMLASQIDELRKAENVKPMSAFCLVAK